jgi:hypothetical protein
VTEPGGIIQIVRNGKPWHPSKTSIRRLGARIEDSPTDVIGSIPLARASVTKVDGGTVYSRVNCDKLDCMFEVSFSSDQNADLAAKCGVIARYLRIDAVSDRGLADARHAIGFLWRPGAAALHSTPLATGN